MKRISLLALVGGLASVTHGANASPGFRGGHSCVDAGPTVPYGLYRTASALGFVLLHFETDGAKLVTCPVTVEQSSMNPTTAYVMFTDGSAGDDIVCTPYLQDDGVMTGLGARYSCATAGGCTSANISWSGTGTLTWADTIGAVSGDLAAAFECSIGKADSSPVGTFMMLSRYEFSH